jgi:hypothetical protein
VRPFGAGRQNRYSVSSPLRQALKGDSLMKKFGAVGLVLLLVAMVGAVVLAKSKVD